MAGAAAAEPAPSASAGADGIPNAARLALLAIVAAVQAVPGYAILSGDEWQPPEAGMFRITAAVAGAALFALVFMARHRLLRLRARVVVAACAGAFALSAVLLFAYNAVLQDHVVTYLYDRQRFRALLPFGMHHWATGDILQVIQQANDGRPATSAGVTRAQIHTALSDAGPAAVLDPVPGGWRLLTMGTLWLTYASALGLIVLGFGIAAVRLGTGIARNRQTMRASSSTAAEPAQAGSAPADAGDDAAAHEPAAQAAEANGTVAESRYRPATVDPSLLPSVSEPAMVSHNGNGKTLGEAVTLRVEFRAPAWAVAGAAAALAFAAIRLATRRGEPRPVPRPPERGPRRRG